MKRSIDMPSIVPALKEGRSFIKNLLRQTLSSTWYNFLFLLMVCLDIFCLCLQTSEYVPAIAGWYLEGIQQLFKALYIVEVMLIFYTKGVKPLKSWWNNFGLVLVMMDLIGLFAPLIVHAIGNFSSASFEVLRLFRALRALRVLRVLRSIRFVKGLQPTVLSLMSAFPTIAAIVATITIVLYIFAIIGRGLYSDLDPDKYGNIALAGFTLFQLLTLDDWFQMYLDVIEKHSGFQHILIFMILFIVIETLVLVNLFVAVIVDTMARTQHISATLQEDESRDVEDKDHEDQNLEDRSKLDATDSTQTDDLRRGYRATVLSLKEYFDREKYHRKTLDKLVDMVDLSKTQVNWM